MYKKLFGIVVPEVPARWQALNALPSMKNITPRAYVGAYGTHSTRQTLFGITYAYPLFCLLLICCLHLPLLVIPFLLLSLYCFILLACLLKTHTAYANNSRSSRIICSYTWPICSNAFLRSYFLQSNFRFRAQLVAQTFEVLLFPFISSR